MQKLLRLHLMKVLLMAAMLAGINSWGQSVSMSSTGSYSQTFDGLPAVTNVTWANNSTISSWYSSYGGSVAVNSGSTSGGGLYSYGTSSNSDRALGTLNTSTTGDMAHAIQLQNSSSSTITSMTVAYTGEQWRKGNNAVNDQLLFYYRVYSSAQSSIDASNSGWTAVNALNFTGPIATTGSSGALDGNGSANRIVISAVTIPSLSIPAGSVVVFKWLDKDITGEDHGIALDDVTINWTVPAAGPTVTTTAGSYGSFCANTSNNIVVNYTTGGVGSFTGTYSVQRSNVGGTFPTDATSNLLTTVTSSAGSITATLPSGLTAGNYRVRVVNSAPATFSSNDNGSNIVLTASVTQAVSVVAVQSGTLTASSATIRGTLGTVGVCPATIEKGFVYSKVSDNNNPLVGGTGVTKTTVSGIATGDYSLALSTLTAETAYNYKAYLYDGTTYTYSNISTFTTTGTPPAITAAVGATVDGPFVMTFTDNATWRGNITSITVDGSTLSATAYDKTTAGQITFTPSAASLLQTPGTKSIVIVSTNYTNATVSQAIAVGAAAKLALTTQPAAPLTNGGTLATQPVVVVRDQYNNLTASTASITAVATASTWTLGGTVTINAAAGTASYSGLTASTPTGLTGAAIAFSSPGLIGVNSNTFSIPPSNDLCGNATVLTLNAAPITNTMVGSTYTTISGVTSKKDVWYSFVAGCNGPHTITAASFSGDIDMTLHAACPTSSTNLATSTNGTPEVLTATLTSGTTYYVRVLAFNTTAETSTFTIQVVNAVAPTVTAGTATGITHQAATVAGTATVTTCSGAVTAYGVEYSLTTGFANGSGTQVAGSNLSGGNFTVALSGLTPGTIYYYKTYATNASGTTYSSTQGTFTTLTVPVTLPYNQNFEGTTNEWAFGTTTTNKWIIGSATQNGGTKSLYISNNGAAYAYTTSSATSDTYADVYVDLTSATAATLSFDWKSGGELSGSTVYDYGELYINTGGSDILISSSKEFYGSTTFQNKEIVLTPYVGGVVKLRFRWVNDNSSGTGIPMAIDNMIITATARPALTTTTISNLAYNAATSGGTITNNGGQTITARGVVYATATNPTLVNNVVSSGTGSGSFASNITGLTDNTTYYVRAYATNATGTSYGNEVTFTTAAVNAPVATAATYSDTAVTGFIANWNASAAATGYKLDVSTVSGFSTETPASITEGFETGLSTSGYQTGDVALGTGTWALVNGIRSSTPQSGTYALQFQAATSASITSPSYNKVSTVTFYARGTAGSTITVRKKVAGTFTTVSTHTLSSTFQQFTSTVNETASDVQIMILNGANLAYVDNIVINYAGVVPSYVAGYNNLSVSGTSKELTGLTAGTNYYYRVRAQGPNSTSANSNVITAMAKTTNIWNGTAWTAGTPPTSAHKAIIQGDYNTSGNGTFTAANLVVNSGIFTIASGTNLTVQDNVVNNQDETHFIIENNGNLIQVNDVDNTGAISVKKNSAPIFRLDYEMWSSPVAGETLIDFSPETIATRFYHYNPISDEYATVPGSTTFAEGAGYLIRVANTHPAFVNAQTPGTSWHGTFVGTPNNGNVDVAVTPQGSGVQGYNAVGNPYPSPINIHAFYAANTSTIADASALYFWRKKNDAATGSYARVTKLAYTANTGNAWGDAGGTAFNGAPNTWVINPGQGFIVQATGSTVHFNNAMRVPVNNGQIFRTAQDENEATISRLWLNLSGQDGFSQAAIGYTDMTTLGLDYGWDGKAFINDGDVTLFSLAGEETLGIQARPSFEVSDVVPMGYQATQAGNYTIALDHMDGVFELDQDIYLQDNLLNVTHDLKQGAYEFTTEAGIIRGRFNVIYAQPLSTDNPVLEANSVIVYKDGNSININSGTVDMTGVSVYDTRGRLLYNGKDINATNTVINGLQAANQVLIVNISTLKGNVSKKIIF